MLSEASALKDLFDNLKVAAFDEQCLNCLNAIVTTEDMLMFLERLEKVVLTLPALPGNQISHVYEIMSCLARNKLDLLVSTIFNHKRLSFINLFSRLKKRYPKSFDPRYLPDSPMIPLFEIIAEYGPIALTICTSLLLTSKKHAREWIVKSLLIGEEGYEEPINLLGCMEFSPIYRSLACSMDSVSRIVEFGLAESWIISTHGNPLPMIWVHLSSEHVPIVLPVFNPSIYQVDNVVLVISNIVQFTLFKELFDEEDRLSDRRVYSRFTFDPEFVAQLATSERERLQQRMINLISLAVDEYINNNYVESYNDIVFKLFQSVLTFDQLQQISKEICLKISENTEDRYSQIFTAFKDFIIPTDFLNLLSTGKLFQGPFPDPDWNLYILRYIDYNNNRSSFIEAWLETNSGSLTVIGRRQVMDYASVSDHPKLFSRVYRQMALNFPIEARYIENRLVEYFQKSKSVEERWESVCQFTQRNREKYFEKFDKFSRFYFTVITKFVFE
jgi:hypothetical protein